MQSREVPIDSSHTVARSITLASVLSSAGIWAPKPVDREYEAMLQHLGLSPDEADSYQTALSVLENPRVPNRAKVVSLAAHIAVQRCQTKSALIAAVNIKPSHFPNAMGYLTGSVQRPPEFSLVRFCGLTQNCETGWLQGQAHFESTKGLDWAVTNDLGGQEFLEKVSALRLTSGS